MRAAVHPAPSFTAHRRRSARVAISRFRAALPTLAETEGLTTPLLHGVGFAASGICEWRHDQERGRSFPVINDSAEASEVLARASDGKEMSGDHFLLESIGANLSEFSEEVRAAYWDYAFALMKRMGGEDIFTRAVAEATAPPPPSAAETLAQTAQEVVKSVSSIAHVLGGQKAFQKKSGQPKHSNICRELFRRGFTAEQIMQAGYNRGTVNDARKFVQAELIKAGTPLPDHLAIRGPGKPGRPRGDTLRTGRGQLADENRDASRLIASVRPLLAKPTTRGRRKGREQTVEGIASKSFVGSYDEGSDND